MITFCCLLNLTYLNIFIFFYRLIAFLKRLVLIVSKISRGMATLKLSFTYFHRAVFMRILSHKKLYKNKLLSCISFNEFIPIFKFVESANFVNDPILLFNKYLVL